MTILGYFQRRIGIAGIFLAAAGCNNYTLGKDDGVVGNTMQDTVFSEAEKTSHMFLDSGNLQSGASYTLETGSLTLNGNMPPKVDITLKSGKLTVLGSVRDDSHIIVTLPATGAYQGFAVDIRGSVGFDTVVSTNGRIQAQCYMNNAPGNAARCPDADQRLAKRLVDKEEEKKQAANSAPIVVVVPPP
jgi:hypothetical protein